MYKSTDQSCSYYLQQLNRHNNTSGTMMRSADRKLHNTIARETKSKVAFSCLLKIRAIGSVITHSTCSVSHKQKMLFSFIFKKQPVEILLYKILELEKKKKKKTNKTLTSTLKYRLIKASSITHKKKLISKS